VRGRNLPHTGGLYRAEHRLGDRYMVQATAGCS